MCIDQYLRINGVARLLCTVDWFKAMFFPEFSGRDVFATLEQGTVHGLGEMEG